MAKLIFNYAAMNSGKTMDLIRTRYNYMEHNLNSLLLKPSNDTKAGDKIETRAGLSCKVDFLINKEENLYEFLKKIIKIKEIKCIFIDEAQFLSEKQVIELFIFCNTFDIPVICYGLRTDFRGELFEGSKTLLALAEELNEFKTLCNCGEIARFNARKVNGKYVVDGNKVEIDNQNDIKYVPLCAKCFTKKIMKKIYIKK